MPGRVQLQAFCVATGAFAFASTASSLSGARPHARRLYARAFRSPTLSSGFSLHGTSGWLRAAAIESRMFGGIDSQEELVQHLQQQGYLKSEKCIKAMSRVDRNNYVLTSRPAGHMVFVRRAYQDSPVANGPETVSAPHIHAMALELLKDKLVPGARILDVGSGSGYLTACFAYAAGARSVVVGVDKYQSLVEGSVDNLLAADADLVTSGHVVMLHGNVLEGTGLEYGPFDAIHVGAAAADIPDCLCAALAPSGKMVIPVGPPGGEQVLCNVTRAAPGGTGEDEFSVEELCSVRFVPLTKP